MRRFLLQGIPLTVVVAAAAIAPLGDSADAQSSAGRPLHTAIVDPGFFTGPSTETGFQRTRAAGASFVRLNLYWTSVAPAGNKRPAGFNPRNPGDPLYRWDVYDDLARTAVVSGLQPIFDILGAPAWAQSSGSQRSVDGYVRPSPSALADFATAAARRYAGGYQGLPRVRYWQIWNEPNLGAYLMPQANAGRPLSPEVYRPMVNAAYEAIHAVHADNVVIAGGTAPFGDQGEEATETPPLLFMRQLLCLSNGAHPQPVCRKRVRFDVWAHHPYTSGNPTHHADRPDNISVPDLWKMRVLLDAASKTGNLVSRGKVGFWVTEFAWDTSPPDPKGVPERLHARWVAEALYRMWSQGVSLVTWFLVTDMPFTDTTPFQAGLYFRGANGMTSDTPKMALTAFRFPFVAFRDSKAKQVDYWGRSPRGRTNVIVEVQVSGQWRHVATMRPNSNGIFLGRFSGAAPKALVRARLANGKDAALPFSLVVPPDRPGCAWGTC